ncbi:MAG: GNAT family N-acetyltransferase [Bacteroidota bacterium]
MTSPPSAPRQPVVTYQHGIPEAHRTEAAALYDQAFGAKLGVGIPDRDRRVTLLAETMRLDYGIGAIANGRLLGLAGFQTETGSLTSGITVRTLRQRLGLAGALRAMAVFALYDRPVNPGELCMDGLVVHDDARGRGIGTRLLQAVVDLAGERGDRSVRLDVIDTNTGARRLYDRFGFEAVGEERTGPLSGLLGFRSATRMEFTVEAPR